MSENDDMRGLLGDYTDVDGWDDVVNPKRNIGLLDSVGHELGREPEGD